MAISLNNNDDGFVDINDFDSDGEGADVYCPDDSRPFSPSCLSTINKEEDLENGPKQKGGALYWAENISCVLNKPWRPSLENYSGYWMLFKLYL
jgi:hypothetical protein